MTCLAWGTLKVNDYIRYVEERAVGVIDACSTETFMSQSNFFNIYCLPVAVGKKKKKVLHTRHSITSISAASSPIDI